jgi:hypothetical protein
MAVIVGAQCSSTCGKNPAEPKPRWRADVGECPWSLGVVVEGVSGPGRENLSATKQPSPTPIAISLFLTLP